jgi:hypothetical protein
MPGRLGPQQRGRATRSRRRSVVSLAGLGIGVVSLTIPVILNHFVPITI